VSGGESSGGASSSSPSSIVGGWPRSDGNDRSGDVLLSEEDSAETARMTSRGSPVVVIVVAGCSWYDRAPTRNSPADARSTVVAFDEVLTVTGPVVRTYSLTGASSSTV